MKENFYWLSEVLSEVLGTSKQVTGVRPQAGGCINQAYQIQTNECSFFLKLNKSSRKDMFEAEAKGLRILSQNCSLQIPHVLNVGEREDYSYLLLNWIEQGGKKFDYWSNLGKGLAEMHQVSHSHFGLDHSNFIGSLEQNNQYNKNWIQFFIVNRLEPQIRIASNSGRLDKSTIHQFESLYKKLNDLLPVESPSLLHGDLWSGNVMSNSKGQPVLIDPAVYFGNREIEIAFTRLFGGFHEEFYQSYNEFYPLLNGYVEREDIYNLYPLLVHVNLFGGGYIHSVKTILQRFV